MVSQIIILQGGEDVKQRSNETLFKDVRKLSSSGKILVIPWTSDSLEKEAEYSRVLHDYFSLCGFEEVLFLLKTDAESEIQRKFSEVDAIYLPGGNTEVLYHELKSRSLQNRLFKFSGTIIGNSAGAIVLTKGGWGDGKFYTGFGLVNFYIFVHYKLGSGPVAERGNTPVISIPENMWVRASGEL